MIEIRERDNSNGHYDVCISGDRKYCIRGEQGNQYLTRGPDHRSLDFPSVHSALMWIMAKEIKEPNTCANLLVKSREEVRELKKQLEKPSGLPQLRDIGQIDIVFDDGDSYVNHYTVQGSVLAKIEDDYNGKPSRIEAIKGLREAYGLGLKDSKDLMEELARRKILNVKPWE